MTQSPGKQKAFTIPFSAGRRSTKPITWRCETTKGSSARSAIDPGESGDTRLPGKEPTMKSNRRRTVLIGKAFQFRPIASFVIVNIVIMALFGATINVFLSSEIEGNLSSAHVSYKNFREMQFPIVLTLSALDIVISSVFVSIFVLFASHKIAGPMFRFKAVLDEFGSRNLKPLMSLRGDDQLQEIADSVQYLASALQFDFREMHSCIHEAKAGLTKSGVNSPGCSGQLDKIGEIIARFRF
jgi:hypothetical protein